MSGCRLIHKLDSERNQAIVLTNNRPNVHQCTSSCHSQSVLKLRTYILRLIPNERLADLYNSLLQVQKNG